MITKLNVTSIMVLNKDEALDYYVNKLGLEKGQDVKQGSYRWLTVRVPGDVTEISLAELRRGGFVVQRRTTSGVCTRRSSRAASPTSPRSPPTTSTAPTWASATRSATPSGSSSRGRSPKRQRPDTTCVIEGPPTCASGALFMFRTGVGGP